MKKIIHLTLSCCAALMFTVMLTACGQTTNYETYEYTGEIDAFTSVDIDISDCPVEFVKSDTYSVEIKLQIPEGKTVEPTIENGTLMIHAPSDISFSLISINNNNAPDSYVIVKVPENEYDTFNVNTSNASVTMSLNGIKVNSINVDTSDGDIYLTTDDTLSITADTSDGNIILNSQKQGDTLETGGGTTQATLDTSNADIQIECAE